MRKFLLKTIFLTGLLACWGGAMAQTSFSANFDNNQLPAGWASSANYKLTPENGALTIAVSKSSWDQFEVGVGTLDISTKPVISFKARAEFDCYVNIGIISGTAGYSAFPVEKAKLVGKGETMDVAFDFTGKIPSGVNASAINKIVLIINPAYNYSGFVYIDDFNVGTTAKKYARVHMPVEQILATGGANKVTQIKGVSTGVSISAASSNTSVLPNPTVGAVSGGVASITFAPSASNHGESMVTLTLTGGGFDATSVVFKTTVNNNIAPVINPILDANLGSGIANEILISGINDGNPEVVQTLTVTATSSDQAVIANGKIQVVLTDSKTNGKLIITPETIASGTKEATITVTVTDNGGNANGGVNSKSITFKATVYSSYYKAPTLDDIADNSFGYSDNQVVKAKITGISDGNGGNKVASLTASATNGSITEPVVVSYIPGSRSAELTYKVSTSGQSSVVTVTVTNTGAPVGSNGNSSTTKTFTVRGVEPPLLGYQEEFLPSIIYGADYHDPNPVVKREDWMLKPDAFPGRWYVEGQGGIMTLTLDGTNKKGTFNCAIPEAKGWSGVWYRPGGRLFDLSQYKYISITMTMNPAYKIAVDIWDVNGVRYGLAETKSVGTTPNTYTYTFFAPQVTAGVSIDMTKIAAVLFNFSTGPYTPTPGYTGTVAISNFKIGNLAENAPPAPGKRVEFDPIGGINVMQNCGTQKVNINNVFTKLGTAFINEVVTLTATSSNTTLIPTPIVSSIVEGKASLSFTPANNQSGTANITLTGKATGCTDKVVTFAVNVTAPNAGGAATITVTPATTYQTITGFGNMIDAMPADEAVLGMGSSVFRMDWSPESTPSLERYNDNSDPNVLDLTAFKHNDERVVKTARRAIELGVDKFIATVWSAPRWTKLNLSDNVPFYSNNDNKVDPFYYEEFAEWIVGSCLAFKEETGVDLFAVSVQNEPEFDEPYGSGKYTAAELKELAKATGLKMQQYGLKTKIYHGEILQAQGNVVSFFQAANNDAVTKDLVYAFANHNYDADGITQLGTGCTNWTSFYTEAQRVNPKKELWMTESSGWASNISGGIEAGMEIFRALTCGSANLWTIWYVKNQYIAPADAATDGFKDKGEVYGAHKNFYFVKPGAVRVGATTSDATIFTTAFTNSKDNSTIVVVINPTASAKQIKLAGTGLPTNFKTYMTSEGVYAQPTGVVTSAGQYVHVLPAMSIVTFVGSAANIAPQIDQFGGSSVKSDAGNTTVKLTGITPVETTQAISTITAVSSDQSLIANADITLGAVAADGSVNLTFKPQTSKFGVALVTVTVKDNGGVANGGVDTKTMTFEVEITDPLVDVSTEKASLKVYPNPAKDMVTVVMPEATGAIVSLTDINGKLVKSLVVAAGQTETILNVNDLSQGVYVLNVTSKNVSIQEKLVIE